MKDASAVICLAVILIMGASAEAAYISTFDVTQADFSLYGFSENGVPTNGPDYLDITNAVGTFDLVIPPAGMMVDITVEGTIGVDFDQDGVVDASIVIEPTSLGEYASSGPATAWGPGTVPLPEVTFEYGIVSFTLVNLLMGFDVDLDAEYGSGTFGANSYMNLVLSNDEGGNLLALNTILTMLDNETALGDSEVGDGVLEGWLSGQVTVTAVPEPAALGLLAIGGAMMIGRRRR